MPLKDRKGGIYAFSSVQRDVSERKEAEARLLAYQEQYRTLTLEVMLVEEGSGGASLQSSMTRSARTWPSES